MANFTENNLLYHIFSKSPVSDATTLAQSLNKSGHTLTTDDIFGEELPAFYDVANTTERDSLTVAVNDICKIGKKFYYYGLNPLKEDGSYGWLDRSAIADGECLFNRSSEYTNNGTDWKNHADEAVVKYHENKDGEFITKDNNGVNGNKFTVRVKKSDGNYIKQFISVTDKIVNSRTSNGYAPLVLQSGSVMEENAKYKDASSDNQRYIANCYAGIIQFPVQKSGTTVASNIKISVWEYIGKTLTEVLKGFATIDSGFNYMVADKYPDAEEKYNGWIYLVPASIEEDNNIYNEFICVNKGTKEVPDWKWEQIGSTAITIPDPPKAGAHLKLENDTYSVKSSTSITDDSTTVPTTQAVYKFFNDNKEKVSHNTIFDLNKFVVEHAHVRWVQKMILWGDGDKLSSLPSENILDCLAWDCGNDTSERRVYIPHCTTFYPNATTQKDAKIQWIKDAMNGVVKTQLVFHLDSHWTYRIIKHMFWQLDEDAAVLNPNAPKYGQEGSITGTYMKPGVTVRHMAFLEDDDWNDSDYSFDAKMSKIDEDNTGLRYYASYIHATWIGENHFSKAWGDSAITWNDYLKENQTDVGRTTLWYGSACDAFTRAYCWTYTVNEQQIKLIKEKIKNITVPGTGKFIKLENNTYSVKTNDVIEDESGLAEEDRTVPTTQAVYNHSNNDEIHFKTDQSAVSKRDGVTDVGLEIYGFVLTPNETCEVTKILINQVVKYFNQSNFQTKCYITVSDPLTNKVFKSSVAKRTDMFGYLDFDGWNEKVYLVKGRKYKVNFLSSETDEKIKITVVYNEHGGYANAHIGHTINDYLTADDSIQTFVDTTKNSPSSGNYTTHGFKIFIHSKKALNENINNIDKELGNIYYHLDNLSNENSLCKVTDEDIERWNTQIIERVADVLEYSFYNDTAHITGVTEDVGGIGFVQLCNNHILAEGTYLRQIKVEQPKKDGTEFTTSPVYLAIYGETGSNGSNIFQLIECSENSCTQQVGADDMVFNFSGTKQLNGYFKYRIFYVSNRSDAETLNPSQNLSGSNIHEPTMAFRARELKASVENGRACMWVTKNGGQNKYALAFPATFVYSQDVDINHLENNERHITQEERERWNNNTSSNISISKNQATTLANQKSVYGHIANDGVLSLGVASANNNTMGVSKLFTGELAPAPSGAEDTAVSLKSIQAMYNTLASLIAGMNTYAQKVTTLETLLDYLYKGYYDVSRANRNTAPDGTHWNHVVHNANNLNVNYIMYDDIDNLGTMYGTVGNN